MEKLHAELEIAPDLKFQPLQLNVNSDPTQRITS